ncbi:MAG TPA: hypothetical protein VGJ84_22900 [Polyangiaceae bacterium]
MRLVILGMAVVGAVASCGGSQFSSGSSNAGGASGSGGSPIGGGGSISKGGATGNGGGGVTAGAPANGGTGGASGGAGGASAGTGGTPISAGGALVCTDIPTACTPIASVPASNSMPGTGCADQTREGFFDSPGIAACAGGWQIPGSALSLTINPQCMRQAGNSSNNPTGVGCTVEDLCAMGWHVCTTPADVAGHTTNGAGCSALGNAAQGLFITRMSWDFNLGCEQTDHNNLVGCAAGGTLDMSGSWTSCDPLNAGWTWHQCACASIAGWCCSATSGSLEGDSVIKAGPDYGGVLCCSNG